MLILGCFLSATASSANKYISNLTITPSSKVCIIPQSNPLPNSCSVTFEWVTTSEDGGQGTFSSYRELYVNGVRVHSGHLGSYSFTASIPRNTVISYQLRYSSGNSGTVSTVYGDYTLLFSHNDATHNTIIGDFNGDGKFENYFQPKTAGSIGGLMPVVSNDFLDSSFHRSWTTYHPQISAIQDWSEESYGVYKGNFNSNPGDELLLLGTKQIILLHGDIITPITIFQPVNNAIVSWNSSHVASHSEFAFDANPADYVVHIGDLTGDSYDEIFLQGKTKGSSSYILSRAGTLIQTITNGYRNMDWSAASYSINLTGGNIVLTALTSADDDHVAYTNTNGVIIHHSVTFSIPERDLASDSVGAIKGIFNVDEGGQANYSIPIYTPAGVAGVTPSLSLNYNSGTGNGIVGLGWNIGGLSAISRCPKSLLINGEKGSVNLDSDDRFCLDGQRLVLLSGVYGEPGSEYRTYPDSKTKVIAEGVLGGGPSHFKVWRSDGSYSEYGSTESSKLRANDGSKNIRDVIILWSQSFSEDRYANRINYFYDKDENTTSSYLERISYAAGEVEINFQYEYRNDQRMGYFQGGKTALLKRLKSIQVNDQDKEIRLYDFVYELSDSEQSRLVSITESKDGVSLQPTIFEWADAEKGIVKDTTHVRTSNRKPFTHADFNDDLIPEGFSLFSSGRRLGLQIFEYIDTGTNMTYQRSCSKQTPNFESDYIGSTTDRFLFDLNGDGVDEILVILPELKSISSEKKQITWYDEDNSIIYEVYDYETVWDSNLYAVFNDDVCAGSISTQFLGNIQSGKIGFGDPNDFLSSNIQTGLKVDNVYFGDIDGDHLPDFVYEKGDGIFVRYHLGSRVTSTNYYSDEVQLLALDMNNNEVSIERISNSRSGDFNADGRLDILLRSNGVWSLYLASANNGKTIFKEHAVLGDLRGNKRPKFQIVDINSDGLLDIVYKDSFVGVWGYSLYTGKKFVGSFVTHVDTDKAIWFLDHNENGKKEIVYEQGARIKYSEYIFNGNIGFFPNTSSNLGGGSGLIGDSIYLADFDGDGSIDIHSVEIKQHTFKGNDYENYFNINKTPFEVRDRIKKIDNGLSNVTNIDYRLLSDPENPEFYDVSSGWYFENGHVVRRLYGPMAVVKKVESSTPSHTEPDNKNGISYRYGNYKTHVMYGALGFEWLETTDLQTGVITRTTYHQAFPYIGQPQKTEVWYGNFDALDNTSRQTRLMSQATNEYETKVVGQYLKADGSQGDLILTYLSISHEQGWYFDLGSMQQQEKISQTVSTFKYNDLGYQVESNIYNCHGYTANCGRLTNLKRIQTVSSYYLDNIDDWILTRLEKTTVSHYREGQETRIRESAFQYDLQTGILTVEEIMPDSTDVTEYLRTEYEHDRFGNTIRKAICSYGVACSSDPEDKTNELYYIHRVNYSEYDPIGRYWTKNLNGYGQVISEVISRNELGQPYIVKDIFGNDSRSIAGTFGQPYFSLAADRNWSIKTARLCTEVTCPLGAVTKIISTSADGSSRSAYKNALGQTLQTKTSGFDGRIIIQESRYNDRGLLYQSSQPYYQGDAIHWTETEYDNLNRIKLVTSPDNGVSETFYEGYDLSRFALRTRESNPIYQSKTEYKNALDELVEAVDNDGNRLNYTYSVFGKLTHVYFNSIEQSSIGYDQLGRKISMRDQDKGGQNNKDWNYAYNALGELVEQTDAKGQKQSTYYDRMGRAIRKTSYDVNNDLVRDERWNFDNTFALTGSIAQLLKQYDELNDELVVEPSYDYLGRNYLTETTIANTIFTSSVQYDSIGRGYISIDASGKGTQTLYNSRGYLTSIKDLNSDLAYQTIQSMDAYGNVTDVVLGNGANLKRVYDDKTGRLISIDTTRSNQIIQSLYYTWDLIGRLRERVDNTNSSNNQSEIFDYDTLNRVTNVNGENRYTYDETGNITWKKGVGYYTYGETCDGIQSGSHAVTAADSARYCYDLNGNMLSGDGRAMKYNTFDKVDSITKGDHTTQFAYGPNHSRYKRVDSNTQGITTTYYLGGVEYIIKSDGRVIYRRSIGGAMIEESSSGSQIHYLHLDHLGSTDAITNANGTVVQNVSFDAFGEKRLSINWNTILNTSIYGPLAITSFGYTGHEMVDKVGIIHMNGRIYDPRLGRFMQADPMIDGATDPQGYNRYTYVRNNPLAYTDPTGFLKTTSFLRRTRKLLNWASLGTIDNDWFGPAASIGCMFANVAAPACLAAVAGATAINGGGNLKDGAYAAGRAYVISSISVGASEAIGAAFPTQVFDRVSASLPAIFEASVAHGLLGGTMLLLQGGKFGHGFASAFTSKFAGSYIHPTNSTVFTSKEVRIVLAGLIGGSVSAATGGKFANGAMQSAIQWAFNDEAHSTEEVDPDIGGYSPASGIYATEDGKVVALYVTSMGLVDESGRMGYGFDYKTGLVWEQGDTGRVINVAPESYLLGAGIGSAGLKAMGPLKQWIRIGPSYSKAAGQKISLSIRWGASPIGNGKYIRLIPSQSMQKFNQWLRVRKLPGKSWRTQDSGHLHIKK